MHFFGDGARANMPPPSWSCYQSDRSVPYHSLPNYHALAGGFSLRCPHAVGEVVVTWSLRSWLSVSSQVCWRCSWPSPMVWVGTMLFGHSGTSSYIAVALVVCYVTLAVFAILNASLFEQVCVSAGWACDFSRCCRLDTYIAMPCLFSDYPFLFFSHPGPPLAEISQPSAPGGDWRALPAELTFIQKCWFAFSKLWTVKSGVLQYGDRICACRQRGGNDQAGSIQRSAGTQEQGDRSNRWTCVRMEEPSSHKNRTSWVSSSGLELWNPRELLRLYRLHNGISRNSGRWRRCGKSFLRLTMRTEIWWPSRPIPVSGQ